MLLRAIRDLEWLPAPRYSHGATPAGGSLAAVPRNDQVIRQWHLLRRLEAARGATLHELADSISDDFPKHVRTIRRDLAALEAAGYPLLTERDGGQTRWRLMDGFRRVSTAATPWPN